MFGHPIRHSASPAMHNAAIAALGLDWRYLAFEVRPEQLSQAIAGAMAMKFVGLNLTVPHKLLAMDMVDVLDASARAWGAVNTIRFEAEDGSGHWRPISELDEIPGRVRSHGFNTDADALVQALSEDLKVKLAGATVLLLGAGGAGRTAALKIASERVSKLFLVNRTRSKVEAVAAEIKRLWPEVPVVLGYPDKPVDLVINATSVGLKPEDALPLDPGAFSITKTSAVYDMIYRPAETLLLRQAREAGARVANGLGMLLFQGARAFEIWSGRAAPLPVMRRALERNVYGN